MANRKQRRTRADVERIHTQAEINRRLYRARNLAYFLRLEMLASPCDSRMLWLPSVLDYIADDIGDIQELFNKPTHTA
ncbi:derepression protein [Salmonella enterica]|nr:derepression protein [Salmonella enterica]